MSKAEILQRRQVLLEVLWRSYVEEKDNLGDLWVDYCVEVLYYSVRISLWIARYLCPEGQGGINSGTS